MPIASNAGTAVSWEQVKEKFEKSGQSHVFKFENQLSPEHRRQLYEDLQDTDPEAVNDCFRKLSTKSSQPTTLRPLPNICNYEGTQADRKRWEKIGYEKIAQGKTGVLLLAGGQGTRLGTTLPKGMYKIGLQSQKSLFQLQAERLKKVQQLAKEVTNCEKEPVIPWYIMTSESTQNTTISYFKENNYFGLNPQNIFFFEQDMIPCITPEGKILMESAHKVARSPNGNGGVYSGLLRSGALADMEKRGTEMILMYGVDNILIKMADPVFFGYCFEENIDCASKVVSKAYPEEPVGVVCLLDNRPGVIEYSEIDKDTAKMIDTTTGKLMYNAAHICMNMLSVSFLKKIASTYLKEIPYHIAKKKIPAVNERGETATPDSINGWKLEMFIFDVFPYATNMRAFEVLRHEEFSPLKNGPDNPQDSPISCLNHLTAYHKQLILNAGGIITNAHEKHACEISPLISYSGENLERHVKGKNFTLPFYLQ